MRLSGTSIVSVIQFNKHNKTGLILERQTLRKIFGPINIDNVWRISNNIEIDKLIEGADVVRFIKAQRIKWLGHIQRMDQARPVMKLLDWKPMGTRPVGRTR